MYRQRRVKVGPHRWELTVDPSPADDFIANPDPEPEPVKLTKRQQQVKALAIKGLTAPQIAKRLRLSERTVEVHIANVLKASHMLSKKELELYVLQTNAPTAPDISQPERSPNARGQPGDKD